MVLGRLCAKALASPKKTFGEDTVSFPPEKGIRVYPEHPSDSPQAPEAGEEPTATVGNPAEFSGSFPSSHLCSIHLP